MCITFWGFVVSNPNTYFFIMKSIPYLLFLLFWSIESDLTLPSKKENSLGMN